MINELPKDWKWTKLEKVCEIISGKNQSKVTNPKGKYPIYGSSGIFGYADKYLCKEGTTVVGRKGTINSPLFVNTKFWNVDTAFGLSPNENYDNKLLYYFCQSFNFHKLDKSTTIPSLAKRDLLAIDLPLPPKPTQQAIVFKIEELFSELDKGIENIRIAQQQLKTYRQSVLKWAFEGKLTNENVKEGELPREWKNKRLGDMFDFVGGGTPSKSENDYWNGNIFWASVKDVKGNYLNKTQDTITEKGLKNSSSNLATPGDVILITRISPGKSIISNVKSAINQDLKIAKPKFKTTSKFINYFFNAIERDCIKIASGTTVLGITLNNLNELEIPELNIDEQNKIVQEIESRLSVVDKMEESINQSLQQAEALRQSILKKAFEGKLA